MKLLVVDDSKDSRESLAELLRVRGHEVATAATSAEAGKLLEACPPDAILLDLIMPGNDTRKLAEMTAQIPAAAKTKILICTGLPSEEPLKWPHVVGILTKPFGVDAVEAALARG